jgi:hypothetical protein
MNAGEATPPPLPSAQPAPRPLLVTIIFFYFIALSLWELWNIVSIFLLAARGVHFDLTSTVSDVFIMLIRAVGIIRLFFMKAEAWLYLAVALLFDWCVLTYEFGIMHIHPVQPIVFAARIGLLHFIDIAIIIYAWRVCNRPAVPPPLPPA